MLLQPADDPDGSAVLLGAWPCKWDVDFSVRAPRNTTVSGSLKNGTLSGLVITPASRAPYIKIRPCASV